MIAKSINSLNLFYEKKYQGNEHSAIRQRGVLQVLQDWNRESATDPQDGEGWETSSTSKRNPTNGQQRLLHPVAR